MFRERAQGGIYTPKARAIWWANVWLLCACHEDTGIALLTDWIPALRQARSKLFAGMTTFRKGRISNDTGSDLFEYNLALPFTKMWDEAHFG
jgi:hypothetical protein